MRVENTLDEVMFAAAHGYAPDDADLEQIVTPPGQERAAFVRALLADVEVVLGHKADGAQGAARKAAEQVADRYREAFEPTVRPRLISEVTTADLNPTNDLRDIAADIPRQV